MTPKAVQLQLQLCQYGCEFLAFLAISTATCAKESVCHHSLPFRPTKGRRFEIHLVGRPPSCHVLGKSGARGREVGPRGWAAAGGFMAYLPGEVAGTDIIAC